MRPFPAWIALLIFSVTVCGAHTPLPISAAIEEPSLLSAELSPDGASLAIVTRKDELYSLRAIDLATGQSELLATFDKARPANLWWKSGGHLLLLVDYGKGRREFHSLEVSSKKVTDLSHLKTWRVSMVHELPRDPEHVIVVIADDLCRLNVRSGKITRTEKNPGWINRWIVTSEGHAIGGVGSRKERNLLAWRKAPADDWSELDLGPTDAPDFRILLADRDGRFLAADLSAQDLSPLVSFDPATGQKETLFTPVGVAWDSLLVWSNEPARALAVVYETDRTRRHFLDAEAARIQMAIDQALPQSVNRVVSISVDQQKMVIFSENSTDAGRYFLLDRKRAQLAFLGSCYTFPAAVKFGRSEAFTYSARDGLELHGRITFPEGVDQPPLVVLMDGYFAGPRSRAKFDFFKQLFATRGMAVAEFDVRGTAGFGRKFTEAGNYQMGENMPRDVVDGVRWLTENGMVNRDKIAVLGFSYAGVTAMHALIEAPDLFIAWVNWNTPLKLNRVSFDDLAMSQRKWTESVTDLGGRRSALKFVSSLNPTNLIGQITVPACHFYDASALDRAAMRGLLRKHKLPHLFIESEPGDDHTTARAKGLESILQFLETKLTPSQP